MNTSDQIRLSPLSRSVSIVGLPRPRGTRISSNDPATIAVSVIRMFYSAKGIATWPSAEIISRFVSEFFEELPPANLVIPFSILERWFMSCSPEIFEEQLETIAN